MNCALIFLLLMKQFSLIRPNCETPPKFFVDCESRQTFSEATNFCGTHQMILLNLTNSSGTLINDISLLNQTLISKNCTGNFWFSSENSTGLLADVGDLGNVLADVLAGTLTAVLCVIPLLCPATTTLSPTTQALTICTRTIAQTLIEKCSTQSQRTDMKIFHFTEKMMTVGLLESFATATMVACSSACSSSENCVGISFDNGFCHLYM